MKSVYSYVLFLAVVLAASLAASTESRAEVRAWEGTISIPTYPWKEDINPKFWALEGGPRLSTTVHGSIIYPYAAQDHLLREKVDHTYKALFLENEYLKVTCLPELGGRLHSVFDKTQNKEMFHLNNVIKPGMIAMRGAWISGGVEWNSGPQGHTVTILSPVDAVTGRNPDGSAYLEISNQEQIFRTRWTVRVTLHPGRAYLDEQISLDNPTDGMHPYYFWNCTAFTNRPGTRYIYPMSLGTDHVGREFFRWPTDKGRDLSWLKNYPIPTSVFSVECSQDFLGAYDVDMDRGIAGVANHHELGGKKAWTWGQAEAGLVSQQNLTDEDGPYIEVQSGPLPTQSDYGMLGPRDRVAWHEWWYPVHGLGDGFEYATRDVAVQTSRNDQRLELRILATAQFPKAVCTLSRDGKEIARNVLDLTPDAPATVTLSDAPQKPVDVRVTDEAGAVLASFTTPLPIAKVDPPDPAKFHEKPDDQMTVEELYLKGRKFDRGTERIKARQYYEKAVARDPGHVASLRALAVLDFEAGLYKQAIARLEKALVRDDDDGLCWFYRGAANLRLGDFEEAKRCGYRAARCSGTASIGYDLAGRAMTRLGDVAGAIVAFQKAIRANPDDPVATDHFLLALYASNEVVDSRSQDSRGGNPFTARDAAVRLAARRTTQDPMSLVALALPALRNEDSLAAFAKNVRSFVGEQDFELLETSLTFAEMGLFDEAGRIVQAACIDAVPAAERGFMPFYYCAWYAAQRGDQAGAKKWLQQAAATHKERVFASRPEEVEILRYAVEQNDDDAQAHLQLGCLLANLGRVDEASPQWQRAAELNPKLSVAWRNLGLEASTKNKLDAAETFYRKAMAADPDDQTLYRDLAEIYVAANKRPEAIELMETMPQKDVRRGEITVHLAQMYMDDHRYDDCIKLLESTPYFVNWEGQAVTWRLFNHSHIERGRQLLEKNDAKAALADFEAALTYPANLNVGRSDATDEAPAQYWRGKALAALGRAAEARQAWEAGAADADKHGRENEYRKKCRAALAGKDKP